MPPVPGCWTCRIRHRKCDLEKPSCKECTDRHVHCHGYGRKPAWMDGGSEERKERSRIKAAIKENFRHVKKMQSRNRGVGEAESCARSETPTNETNGVGDEVPLGGSRNKQVITPPHPSHSPSSPHDPAKVTGHRATDSPGKCTRDHTEPELFAESSPQPSDHNGFDFQEACLLMHYLDQVFPWQFPYHDSRSRLGNRGWLFSLLIKRGPFYHATLSLSSLHQSGMRGTEEEFQRKQMALDNHSRALGELCAHMGGKGDKLRDDDAQLSEFLACTFILTSFEVYCGAERDWLMHLDAVTSVINLLSPEAIFNRPSNPYDSDMNSPAYSHYTRGGANEGLEFLVVTFLWLDLFACLSTGRVPGLPYQRWLQIPGLNTAELMGCHNWVMTVIGDLAHFGAWRQQQEKGGLLSIRELASRGQEIEWRLETGIERLDLARDCTEAEALTNSVTRLFALASLVLLHTIVSGPLPALPEIQSAVARSIIALQNRPKAHSLTGSVWALCVIGCMAQPRTRPFFETLMMDLLRRSGRCGNGATILKIMRKCWEMQETIRADCRIAMSEMGLHAILI